MMPDWAVDLYSDTKTRPSAAMRAAMASAIVGDEQQGEDPTVAALNDRVARLLGKDEALFLPSGTMANVISILVHCQRGDEILAEASSHVLHFETGGPAGVAGATVTPLTGEGGLFTSDALTASIRPPRRNGPRPRLVWVEQTTNLGGGRVWPLETLASIGAVAHDAGLAVHIDGARLLNAAVASGTAPALYGRIAASLWIDFTKGLGAPFGAVLAGSRAFINDARRYKHMLGGAMRQGGIMAAACLYALDHHVTRLSDDHAVASALAAGMATMPGIRVANLVETNIVILDVSGTGRSAQSIDTGLRQSGVRASVFGTSTLRLITHLDLAADAVAQTLAAFRKALR